MKFAIDNRRIPLVAEGELYLQRRTDNTLYDRRMTKKNNDLQTTFEQHELIPDTHHMIFI
jgi:hypothetical protein